MRALTKPSGRWLIAALGACLALATSARASGGPLDPSFGQSGVVITPQAGGVILALAEDHRGRLLAAGTSGNGFVLARYRRNGRLDPTFRGGAHSQPGIVTTQVGGGAYGVAVQRDGKILAAGSNQAPRESGGLVLVRYLPSGSLDPHFGVKGRVRTRLGRLAGAGLSMALAPSGDIIVGGFIGPPAYLHRGKPAGLVIRYLPDGSPDRSFANNGQLRIRASGGRAGAITDVEVLPDRRLLVAGNIGGRLLLERLLPDGQPDPSFGAGDGQTSTRIGANRDCEGAPITSGLALKRGGGILLAGSAGCNSALISYDHDGTLDRRFGRAGVVRLPAMGYFGAARDVVKERDGKILVVGGSETRPLVQRFLADGKPDLGFARAGAYSRRFRNFSQLCAVLQQPSGRLVLGGRADSAPVSLEAEDTVFDAQFLLLGLRP